MADDQIYLYRIQPQRVEMLSEGPRPEEEAAIERHARYLQSLVDEGRVLLAGRTLVTDETSFGLVILRAASEEEARRIMREDPAVAEGVMHSELFPFRVAMAGPAGLDEILGG